MQEQSCKEDAPHTSRDAHRGQYVELCAGAKNAKKLKRRKADTDALDVAAAFSFSFQYSIDQYRLQPASTCNLPN